MEGEGTGGDDHNPFSLGLTFSREGDRCIAIFSPRPDHHGVPGFLHGGLAATALDETMASVGYMLDRVHCVTATLELKYRKPVPLGRGDLRVEGWRTDLQPKRRHKVHGRLLLPDGTVAVEASGIFISMPTGATKAWQS